MLHFFPAAVSTRARLELRNCSEITIVESNTMIGSRASRLAVVGNGSLVQIGIVHRCRSLTLPSIQLLRWHLGGQSDLAEVFVLTLRIYDAYVNRVQCALLF